MPGRAEIPEGEVRATVLAEFQLGDRCQKPIDDSLAARSCFWQCLQAVTALAPVSSPAQSKRIHKSRKISSQRPSTLCGRSGQGDERLWPGGKQRSVAAGTV
jgi:hypothetical protein